MYRLFYLIVSISISQNSFNQDGQRHGRWMGYHENGQIKYQGTFINGDEIGVFEYYDYSGNKVIQLNHIYQGISRAQLFYKNGIIKSKGEYLNKQKNGLWIHYNVDGIKIAQEQYLHNILNGQCTYFHLNGITSEIHNYENGVRSGISSTFYQSGRINTTCNYNNGELNGLAQFYYNINNNQIESFGYYKNGIKDSIWIFYNELGDTLRLINYNN